MLITIALMLFAGFYCLLFSRNLIRLLIALEVLTKGVTLLLILAGSANGDLATVQSFVITLIIIEVVIMVVAAGIVLGVFRHTGSLDVRKIRNLKG
jgi:multisubunit Na+/H+ antiporter MnhC subunit